MYICLFSCIGMMFYLWWCWYHFCLLAYAGSWGIPLAYLVGHDPRYMGVIGDALVPQRPRLVKPTNGPKKLMQRHRWEIGGPSSEGSSEVANGDTEWWCEYVEVGKAFLAAREAKMQSYYDPWGRWPWWEVFLLMVSHGWEMSSQRWWCHWSKHTDQFYDV